MNRVSSLSLSTAKQILERSCSLLLSMPLEQRAVDPRHPAVSDRRRHSPAEQKESHKPRPASCHSANFRFRPILLKKSEFRPPQKLRGAGKKCPTMLQTCRNADVSVMEYVGRGL